MNPTPDHHEESADEIGATIVESALLKFLSNCSSEDQQAFAQFVEANEKSPTLVDDLRLKFPDFGSILDAEFTSFQAEFAAITNPD